MLMDGIWLVAVGVALVILTSVKPLMTSLGKRLVAMDLQKGLDRAGLRARVMTLHDGVSAHYHERPALGEVLTVLPWWCYPVPPSIWTLWGLEWGACSKSYPIDELLCWSSSTTVRM